MSTMSLLLSVILVALTKFTVHAGGPRCVARFEHGIGAGVLKETFTNRLYCAYLGIPFVKPPMGELRFEDPVPFYFEESATFDRVSGPCVQELEGSELLGSEDCLYLNVYSTYVRASRRPRPRMPVLVWIHGGSFVEGSSETDIYGPEFLLDEDVLVVTFNYRLAALGFLGVDDLDISANLGLKDQTEALRWVARNIRSFGGDPGRVTLLGWSAGAASATYHLYSRASKGLFQRVIAMSGTMTQPWAFSFNARWCANQYLEQIDATTREELKARPARLMVPSGNGLKYYYFSVNYLCYMPSRDPLYAPVDAYELVRTMPPDSDGVPLLFGSTAIEHQNLFNQRRFQMHQSNYPNDNGTVYDRLVDYLERCRANRPAGSFYRKLSSFADFSFGSQFFVEHASRHFRAPIFRYRFAFDGPFAYAKNVFYRSQIDHPMPGAMHGDDLGYLFTPYNYRDLVRADNNSQPVRKALKVQRRVVRLWTNFIKTGNPTPASNNRNRTNQTVWHPYNDRNPQRAGQFLDIDRQMRLVRDKVTSNYYYQLWRTVFGCLYYFECDFLDDWPASCGNDVALTDRK